MNDFNWAEPQYEATNDKLYAFLATNSDISKLALKIQATNSFKLNTCSLKKCALASA